LFTTVDRLGQRDGDNGLMEPSPDLTAEYFDGWYADMVHSTAGDEIMRRHLGLPSYLLSTSLLSWNGIGEVVDALRLAPGRTLLDLACGRGGYGLEIANRTGAVLVGVDFSAEAVRQARENGQRLRSNAEFSVGDMTATGIDTGSIDAVVCVDAIQFAEPPQAAFQELHRVLAPGGRVVLTSWEPIDRYDDRVPERMRRLDLAGGLTQASFVEVEIRDRPGWRTSEHAMWEEAAALDPGDDAALRSLQEEALQVLPSWDLTRRVMASATALRSAVSIL
jgi:SAM-dependent methyltransferase